MSGATRLYLDAGSPYAYLAAERVDAVLGAGVVWEPILLGAIFKATGGGSWALTPAREAGMREVERRAAAYGLPPVRWPQPWPGNMLAAMRAATAADALGGGRALLLALLRASFRDGRDLGDPAALRAVVERAAPAAGLDAQRLLDASSDAAVKARLRERTEAALAQGVTGVPTVLVGTRVFWGDDRLEEAAAQLGR